MLKMEKSGQRGHVWGWRMQCEIGGQGRCHWGYITDWEEVEKRKHLDFLCWRTRQRELYTPGPWARACLVCLRSSEEVGVVSMEWRRAEQWERMERKAECIVYIVWMNLLLLWMRWKTIESLDRIENLFSKNPSDCSAEMGNVGA